MKYVFITEFFESSSLALQMKLVEKKEVKVYVTNKEYKKILDGMIPKEDNFVQYLGQKNLFITDDADAGRLADTLREKGEMVFGGSKVSDRMENERAFGQKMMKEYGINTVESVNFKGNKAFDEGIEFVKKNKGRWVIKQNGDADKSFSSVGKFDNGEDILDKLNDFKHIWTETIDYDLQKFVDGYEVGVEGWFNGKEWIKDKTGEPVFTVNWEHKKKSDGDTGRTTGETGTLAYRVHKDSKLAKEIIKMEPVLKNIKYIGNFDINFILSKLDGKFYGLEFTCRFGYPALNYFQEMLKSPFSELLEKCATGGNGIDLDPRWTVVTVVQVPPFPFHTMIETERANGQRIYFTEDGKWDGKDRLTTFEKLKHIHLYEVKVDKETKHFLATGDTGYLLTVTAQGNTPKEASDRCLNHINKNIYTSNMDFRKDIGINKRVRDSIQVLAQMKAI